MRVFLRIVVNHFAFFLLCRQTNHIHLVLYIPGRVAEGAWSKHEGCGQLNHRCATLGRERRGVEAREMWAYRIVFFNGNHVGTTTEMLVYYVKGCNVGD